MKEVGSDIADVQGVMVTHIHPDHYGLAGRIREASGAWISLHPADAELIHDRYDEPDDLLDRVAAALRRMGAPAEELEPLQNAAMPVRPLVDAVVPDVLFEDGARPEVSGWDLTAIWTPGHSPGHLCFYEATQELMLSGDHVLPRITPNIPYHPQAGANPLGDYLLARQARALQGPRGSAGPRVPLRRPPRPPGGVAPAPWGAIRRGHRHSAGGARTAWYVAQHMKWSRPWDDIAGFMRRAAVGEAVSHLRVLEIDGLVQVEDGEPALWSLAAQR